MTDVEVILSTIKEIEDVFRSKKRKKYYINDKEHLIKYIKYVMRLQKGRLNIKDLLPVSVYIDCLFHNRYLTDRFTWELREEPELLEYDNFGYWLHTHGIDIGEYYA